MLKTTKATPACLSQWRISQLALMDDAAATAAEQRHLGACHICASATQHERSLVTERRKQDLPASLKALLTAPPSLAKPELQQSRRGWFMWPSVSIGVLAAAAGAMLLVWMPAKHEPSERLKGASALHVSAMRGDQIIANDVPWNELPILQDGDRLRLRAVSTHRWYALWAHEGAPWTVLGQGDVPKDGWLPLGLRYTGQTRSDMALLLCPQEPKEPTNKLNQHSKPKGCERVEFAL